ncbi:MAG: hypothetical protein IJ333_06115, partial [Clostridia bacterium]|nr:hypothetical protein [Clostridia bacterium]
MSEKLEESSVSSITPYTYQYTYDTYGNIRTAKKYNQNNALVSTETYSYTDSTWKDLLTAYNGQTITYDAIGNPLAYYNGKQYNMTWKQGRQLATVAVGGTTTQYAYDTSGLRTSKTVGSTTYHYLYNGNQLVEQTWGNNRLIFSYDEKGLPLSFYYRNSSGTSIKYYYVLNAQGDVVQLRN